MNNEQKKEYTKPEITIVEMDHEANLLQESRDCPENGDGSLCTGWNG